MYSDLNKSISIIIPCYNAEATITASLASVFAQTYENIETVIVDDCSTDSTSSVISRCLADAGDRKTVFLHNEVNSGVSFSRNRGLDAAHGSYVMFLDADDTLDSECCMRLVEMMSAGDVQCAACNATRILPDGRQAYYIRKVHDTQYFSGEEYAATLKDTSLFDTSCAKLYDREFLNRHNLRFVSSIPFGEDTLFANLVALKAAGIAVCTTYSGYIYRDNPAGCCNTITTRKRLNSLRQVLCHLEAEVQADNRRFLLRKSKEYVWTIKRGVRSDSGVLLKEMISSALWREILFPVLCAYGSFKHRLISRLLNRGIFCVIRLW